MTAEEGGAPGGVAGAVVDEDLLVFDTADPDYSILVGYAKRIETLFTDPATASNKGLIASLDFFVGAICALIWAKKTGFVDRPHGNIETRAIEKRTADILKGALRLKGPW